MAKMMTSTNPSAFRVRSAQPEEAGAFFAQTSGRTRRGGHVRMVRRKQQRFWHTWHPARRRALTRRSSKRNSNRSSDKLRETVLKDLSSMRFCYENGGKIPSGWAQNYGYVVETGVEKYCLRCNPVQGDYQAYLSCLTRFERAEKINHYQPLVGRIHFINGDAQRFTMPKHIWTASVNYRFKQRVAFGFRTITQDPAVRKAVDDIVYDCCGERKPVQQRRFII